jgi:hypothetical protein
VSFNGALVEAALLFAGQMPNIKGSEAGHLLRLNRPGFVGGPNC